MKQFRQLSSIALLLIFALMAGCAATSTSEGTGEYIDDSVITAKVKLAILNEPSLKSSEINVETFKGIVQLSGFVSGWSDKQNAVKAAQSVGGVKSVKEDMQVK